ncbi:MAG: CPBP family intramembrane glutamic endopeptidase [Verrucomicrobiales bacterium]
MAMEEESSEPVAEIGADRGAAWWCWPVIAVSLVVVAWGVDFLRFDLDPELVPTPISGRSDLGILKLQAQVVIAVGTLDQPGAADSVKDLVALARDDRAAAAVVLLERFVSIEDPGPNATLEKVSGKLTGEFGLLVRKAVAQGVDPEEREALRSRLGWFAELAPGPGLSEPPRAEEIRRSALAFLAVAVLVAGLGVCGLIVGAVLLLVHVRKWSRGERVNRFDPRRKPIGVMLECFALYLGIMVAGDVGAMLVHPSLQIVGYGLSVVIPLLWPMARGIGWRDFRIALGWHKGRGWLREIGAGMVGYLAVLSIASIGIFLTLLLTLALGLLGGGEDAVNGTGPQAPVTPETHPIVGWIYGGDFVARLLCLILASGFAPLFEETFFRGALHRYFRGRFRFFLSAFLTSVIFAALHPQGLVGIPALAAIGIGFSLIREWRDSLVAPMVAHALNNGVLIAVLWVGL